MAVKFILDTSVLTRMRFDQVRRVIRPIMSWGLAGRSTLSDLELGHSARNATEWDRIRVGLESLQAVDVRQTHVDRALEVQRTLAERGLRGRPLPDPLIAAAAEECAATLVHYDRDFDLIADVTGQPTRWAVVAGSID